MPVERSCRLWFYSHYKSDFRRKIQRIPNIKADINFKYKQFDILLAINIQNAPKIKACNSNRFLIIPLNNSAILPNLNELKNEFKLVDNNVSWIINGYINTRWSLFLSYD